jgi:predicted metal-dependent hydrolase
VSLERGLELMRAERWFDAHEALEDEWRDAPEPERDFLQGLVQVEAAAARVAEGLLELLPVRI